MSICSVSWAKKRQGYGNRSLIPLSNMSNKQSAKGLDSETYKSTVAVLTPKGTKSAATVAVSLYDPHQKGVISEPNSLAFDDQMKCDWP